LRYIGYTSCRLERRDGFWKWALPAFFYVRTTVVAENVSGKELFFRAVGREWLGWEQ